MGNEAGEVPEYTVWNAIQKKKFGLSSIGSSKLLKPTVQGDEIIT